MSLYLTLYLYLLLMFMYCLVFRMSAVSANCTINTKYLLQHLLAGARKLHSPARDMIIATKSL